MKLLTFSLPIWIAIAQVDLSRAASHIDAVISGREETPPVIVIPPRGQEVAPGSLVIFRVEATGQPAPSFQWRLNGSILANETNRTLRLEKVQSTNSGSYAVTVWNNAGVVVSPPALLRVRGGQIIVAADDFKHRTTWRIPTGIVQGNSTEATTDPDEPVPVGGGKTIWFEWIAPDDGIVTFDTRGSAFDTLLTVFAGRVPSPTNIIAQDDDSGGLYSSLVQFNVEDGAIYQIQMAGYDYEGVGGEFTLGWLLEQTKDLLPRFVIAPQPQGVLKGERATFRALTDNAEDLYQWFFNGKPILGATKSSLTLDSVDMDDVGLYHVVARNKNRSIRSERVGLQVSLFDAARRDDNFLANLHDKYQAITQGSANGNRPGAGWISIGLGDTVGKQAYSGSSAQQGDPTPCNAPLYGTVFQGLHAEDNGTIRVDTIGSATLARLAVYRGAVGLGEVLIACDLTNGPAGAPCLVNFTATDETNYTVVVEGYEAAGNLSITCRMGVAPTPPFNPLICAVPPGGSMLLTAPGANWSPPPTRRWFFNGSPLTGQAGPTLTINAFDASKVGVYSVVLSNFLSVVTNTVAQLSLAGPFLLGHQWVPGLTNPKFILSASNTAAFVVETTTNLNGVWLPIATNFEPCLLLRLTNANAWLDSRRFYRAVPFP